VNGPFDGRLRRYCHLCGAKMLVLDDRTTEYDRFTGLPTMAGRVTFECPAYATSWRNLYHDHEDEPWWWFRDNADGIIVFDEDPAVARARQSRARRAQALRCLVFAAFAIVWALFLMAAGAAA
jgi:hypothetical protein